ncbi:MAG: DNA polymerase IV [Methanobacteriota archaeon]
MPRIVALVDLDAFYVSVDLLDRPDLRGLPVVVGADPREHGRGVVTSASYEARKYGIRSAMPCAQALRLCPDLVFLSPDFGKYWRASRLVMDTLKKLPFTVEEASIDEAFLDLSSLSWGEAPRCVHEIKDTIREASGGLSASVGVAPTKSAAKMVADLGKPDGAIVVPPERLREVLDPLPARAIPGVGPKTAAVLSSMGIETVGELARMPGKNVASLLGAHGEYVHAVANGRDDTPVMSDWGPAKSMGSETTLEEDSRSPAALRGVLRTIYRSLAGDLEESGYWYRTVTLKVRYSDFTTISRQHTLKWATPEPEAAAAVLPGLLAAALEDGRAIRLLGVQFGNLRPQTPQRRLPRTEMSFAR